MAKKNFSVDDTLYKAQAKKLVRELKLDEPKFVREQGGFLAQTLSKVVPPFIGSPKLKGKGYGGNLKIGRSAIFHDMDTMFAIRAQGYLEFLHRTTGKKRNVRQVLRTKTGKQYLVDVDFINYDSVGEAMDFHESQQRPSSGRAKNSDQGSNDSKIGRWQPRMKMWITEKIWKSVAKELNSRVGIAKASLAEAAVKLGRPAPPKWISKHFSRVNTPVRMTKNPTVASFTASAKGIEPAIRRFKQVESFRLKAMVKRLKFLVKADSKKAGFKTR
jgi:hypothetical protein